MKLPSEFNPLQAAGLEVGNIETSKLNKSKIVKEMQTLSSQL
jgi:hypothetical protein